MFAKMLRQIMKERHLTQTELAKQIGVTRPSINGWLNGSVPSNENIDALCKVLNVERSLLQNGVQSINEDETSITIPALDRKPIASANETDGNRGVLGIRFSKEWLNSRSQTNVDSIRIYNITGTSMVSAVEEGDLLIVDTSVNKITSTGIYIIQTPTGNLVRRIYYDPDQNTATFILDNESYPNITNDNPETIDVVGKVIFGYKRITNF